MFGDRLIILGEPTGSADDLGGQGTAVIEHSAWAIRRDLGGRPEDIAATDAGVWRTRFEFPWSPVLDRVDETWALRDERGRLMRIESVQEAIPPRGQRWFRRAYIWIIARRTEGLTGAGP